MNLGRKDKNWDYFLVFGFGCRVDGGGVNY